MTFVQSKYDIYNVRLAKLKIFPTVEVKRAQQDCVNSGGGTFVSGFGHLRDITAFRWPEASSSVVPARTLKPALTQTEEGDGSCAFVWLKTFAP